MYMVSIEHTRVCAENDENVSVSKLLFFKEKTHAVEAFEKACSKARARVEYAKRHKLPGSDVTIVSAENDIMPFEYREGM